MERHEVPGHGEVATLTLNDPTRLNALTVAMGEAVEGAVASLCSDAAVRCVIVRGAGRAFSAGGDLEWLRERSRRPRAENVETMRRFYARFLSLRRLEAPTVACLHGPAVGAGAALALACDVAVASQRATLGLNFVRLGLPPGMGASATAPAKLGQPLALRAVYEGATLSAQDMLAAGLVAEVHADADAAYAAARAYAARVATIPHSAAAARLAVRLGRAALDKKIQEQTEAEAHAQSDAFESPDFAAAIEELIAKIDDKKVKKR